MPKKTSKQGYPFTKVRGKGESKDFWAMSKYTDHFSKQGHKRRTKSIQVFLETFSQENMRTILNLSARRTPNIKLIHTYNLRWSFTEDRQWRQGTATWRWGNSSSSWSSSWSSPWLWSSGDEGIHGNGQRAPGRAGGPLHRHEGQVHLQKMEFKKKNNLRTNNYDLKVWPGV